MSYARGFFYRNKKHIVFIILFIVSVITLNVTYNQQKGVEIDLSLRSIGYAVISPFSFGFYKITEFFSNTVNSISEVKKMTTELEALRNTLQLYQKVSMSFSELEAENRQLREMLRLKEEVAYETEVCRVIGSDPKSFFDVLYLNKGSNDGLRVNMPVISYISGKRVLIGKIADVSLFSSKVITLNNRNLNIGCFVGEDRIQAVVQGNNEVPGMINIRFLPKTAIIKADGTEYIYTSGNSFIYPKGIEIGSLEQIVYTDNYEVFNEGVVKLSVNFSTLEMVMVIKTETTVNPLENTN